jgi:hypothetical protein
MLTCKHRHRMLKTHDGCSDEAQPGVAAKKLRRRAALLAAAPGPLWAA